MYRNMSDDVLFTQALTVLMPPTICCVRSVRDFLTRSGGQVLKQERVPKRRHSDTAGVVLTKLRVHLGLPIATMAE